jgi:hypothetical protein
MPDETKIEPFKPQQPQIPGVPADAGPKKSPAPKSSVPPSARMPPHASSREISPLWVGLATGFVVIVVGIAWWAHGSSVKPAAASSSVEDTRPLATATEAVKPQENLPLGPGPIATVAELAKPWSSKRFIFRNPVTSERTQALAVRLPGGALWGISLREPYGTCELEYITDLEKLRSQYEFPARHPMVANPCNGTVYDLARYSAGPSGLVRGEIVRGTAVRPPIGIDVETRGSQIVALQIE